jgi:hypothetical protein
VLAQPHNGGQVPQDRYAVDLVLLGRRGGFRLDGVVDDRPYLHDDTGGDPRHYQVGPRGRVQNNGGR